jgi:hypothetical protein
VTEHEDHPCGLCDAIGRCTGACEHADEVPAPTAAQSLSARYWAMLVLSAKVLDDLAEPTPVGRTPGIRAACSKLAKEIRELLEGEAK